MPNNKKPLTPEQAMALLDGPAARRGRKAVFTAEERTERNTAAAKAASDARTALAHLYPEDYAVLYATARARRLAELGWDA